MSSAEEDLAALLRILNAKDCDVVRQYLDAEPERGWVVIDMAIAGARPADVEVLRRLLEGLDG